MDFRQRVLEVVLVVSGIILGVTLNAHGEAPGSFYAKNLAKCFYCDTDNSIQAAGQSQAQPADPKPMLSNTKSTTPNTTKDPVGVDPKAPEAFKNFVRAYESGNMNEAYDQAKAWVNYQETILRRTNDLAALVTKAKMEISADKSLKKNTEVLDSAGSLREAIEESGTKLRVYFFFDPSSSSSQSAATEIEALHRSTLTKSNFEVVGIADGESSIDDVENMQSAENLSFPVRFDQELASSMRVSSLPTVLAVTQGDPRPCRYEGPIEQERISDFIQFCIERAKIGRR